MSNILREYQTDAILKLRRSLASGKRRPVVQMPTGAGKTIAAAEIVRMARDKGKRVLFCVPSISLIDQTVEKFERHNIWEIGVIQAMHERTDPSQPVQVCSVQTLARRSIPEADLIIVDECHVMFKFYDAWFNHPQWETVPIVGLTATPWSKGMGLLYDDLIIGTTTQELIDLGHLSDFKVFAPAHPDLNGVTIVGGDYNKKQLGTAMDKSPLVADIVSTWLDRANNRSTICFAVNRSHAKHIQGLFLEAGIPTGYMDAFTDLSDRAEIAKQFADGDLKIICNVGVLTTGVDWDVRCIILARPTRSEILYTQMIGRGLRTALGKDHCLILDHSDTTIKLGFVTDISYEKLDDGKGKGQAEREKKVALPKACPKCTFLKPPSTAECPACGFKAEAVSKVASVTGELLELGRDGKGKVGSTSTKEKEKFYRELRGYAIAKGYKDGWAYWAYKDRFGVGPSNSFNPIALSPSSATFSYVRHMNIVRAKKREKSNGQTYSGSSNQQMAGTPTAIRG
jgi:superfamily II DNA or RNA helicase